VHVRVYGCFIPSCPAQQSPMKLATWNVNSLKVRLPQLLAWVAAEQPDIVCLQETKLDDPHFPRQEIEAAGYHVVFSGQKTYNGVALLARNAQPISSTATRCTRTNRSACLPPQSAASASSARTSPTGRRSAATNMLTSSNGWMDSPGGSRMHARSIRGWSWPAISTSHQRIGTSTIRSPGQDKSFVRTPERAAFQRLLALGLKDSFRLFEQPAKSFSWWDYRMLGFQKNQGLRIDHILLSEDTRRALHGGRDQPRIAQAGAALRPRAGDCRNRRLMDTPQDDLPQTLLALYPPLHSLSAEQLAAICRATALLKLPAGAQVFAERQNCFGVPADSRRHDQGGEEHRHRPRIAALPR
jgi:exodeoxyribonuclease-3